MPQKKMPSPKRSAAEAVSQPHRYCLYQMSIVISRHVFQNEFKSDAATVFLIQRYSSTLILSTQCLDWSPAGKVSQATL